jgi:hypothetical protein
LWTLSAGVEREPWGADEGADADADADDAAAAADAITTSTSGRGGGPLPPGPPRRRAAVGTGTRYVTALYYAFNAVERGHTDLEKLVAVASELLVRIASGTVRESQSLAIVFSSICALQSGGPDLWISGGADVEPHERHERQRSGVRYRYIRSHLRSSPAASLPAPPYIPMFL